VLLVRKSEEIVTVKGRVGCTVALTCSKCLEEFSFPVEAHLDIELAPEGPDAVGL